MLQSPQVQQYMPVQQQLSSANNQQPAVASTLPNTQAVSYPNGFYSYPTASAYMPANSYTTDRAQYNGVNIEIQNPQGMGCPMGQNQVPAQLYPVPQMVYPSQYPAWQQMMQPAAAPVQTTQPQPALTAETVQEPQQMANVVEQPQVQTEQVPQPQIQQTPEQPQAAAPVVEQSAAVDASVSPETFAGKLKSDDLSEQQNTLEELAQIVKEDDTAAPALLDTQVMDALVDIVNKDTSGLEGPSPEVIDLRNKPEEERTPEENEKANTASPLEQAESNKQYALYTISYMQERLNNELEKNGGQALALNELPCIDNVIEAAKSNPDPMVRVAGIAALSHIARPEYKEDLATIFDLAKSDEDEDVKAAAESAAQALEVK